MANEDDVLEFQSLKPWLGSFLNLDKPRRVTQSANEKEKFSLNAETDDEQEIARFKAAVMTCAREKWPQLDVGAAIAAGRFAVPLINGTKLADKAAHENENPVHKNFKKNKLREWSRGKQVLTARSEFFPPVTIIENGQVVVLEDPASVSRVRNKFFFTGANILFAVKLNAYDAVGPNGLPGVNAYLRAVEGTGTGTPLIARRDPTERFSHYRGLATQEDPTREPATADSDW